MEALTGGFNKVFGSRPPERGVSSKYDRLVQEVKNCNGPHGVKVEKRKRGQNKVDEAKMNKAEITAAEKAKQQGEDAEEEEPVESEEENADFDGEDGDE